MLNWLRGHVPPRYRDIAKFVLVGGVAYVVDVSAYFLMVHTFLPRNPITAGGISALIATIVSYVLNSEWAFATRGGRTRKHEATLFFVMNGIAMGITLVPLAISRYVLGFGPANYSAGAVNVADFVSRFVIGVGLGMIFRYWSYRRFVFPDELGRADNDVAE